MKMKRVVTTKDHYLVVSRNGDLKIYGELAKVGKSWVAYDADTEKTKTFRSFKEADEYFRSKISA